jgi:hypothetical protein
MICAYGADDVAMPLHRRSFRKRRFQMIVNIWSFLPGSLVVDGCNPIGLSGMQHQAVTGYFYVFSLILAAVHSGHPKKAIRIGALT